MHFLKIINNDLDNSSPDTPLEMNYLVSGEIIECWMLKVLLGIYFSKNAGGPDGPSIDKFPLDMNRVLDALYNQSWGKRCGLYIACPPGTEIKTPFAFEVMLLCGLSKNMVYGARICVQGLEFYIVIDDLDGHVLVNDANAILRPSNITYQSGVRTHRVVLTWADLNPTVARGVTATRTPKSAVASG